MTQCTHPVNVLTTKSGTKIVRKRIPTWSSVAFLHLWPNGWMDQDATWWRGRPRPRPYCVRWGPSPHSSPSSLSVHAYCGQTVAHLSNCWALVYFPSTTLVLFSTSLSNRRRIVWRYTSRSSCGKQRWTPIVTNWRPSSVNLHDCTSNVSESTRYWSKIADSNLCLVSTLRVNPFEFHQGRWHQKTRVTGLLCSLFAWSYV